MNEEFITLLKEQLELEKQFAALDSRLIDALDRAYQNGHRGKIIVTLDGEVYSIGPAKALELMRWAVQMHHEEEFRFHPEGKTLS